MGRSFDAAANTRHGWREYGNKAAIAICVATSLISLASAPAYAGYAQRKVVKFGLLLHACSDPITLPVFNRPLQMVVSAGSSTGERTKVSMATIMGFNLLGDLNRLMWTGLDGSGGAESGASATEGDIMIDPLALGTIGEGSMSMQVVNASQFKVCNHTFSNSLTIITFFW